MTDADKQARRTRILVLIGIAVYSVYDLVVKVVFGGVSTISTAVGGWLGAVWYGWAVCIILGGLFGHLVGMMPVGTPHLLWRVLVVGMSAAVAYWVTVKS